MLKLRIPRATMKLGLSLTIFSTILLAGCGGGGSTNSTSSALSPADVAKISPNDIAKYDIVSFGENIKYLGDATLAALSYVATANVSTGSGQVGAITAAQIAVLTPAKVRMIGAAGYGGTISTSHINQLNDGAWAALVSDPAQVSAISAAETPTLFSRQITALGTNIKYLSDADLAAFTYVATAGVPTGSGQIGAITAAQIAALTPAQMRMLGAVGMGGAITTSQITQLNTGAWSALASDPVQVAAITAAETATLLETQIVALGTNIQYLSDASLNALSPWSGGRIAVGQIESITAAQIATLTPAQVRMIGAAGPGGTITTSLIYRLNSGTWATLVSDPNQVAAITPAEIATLTLNYSSQITALGTNINTLSDAALGSLTANTWGINSGAQIQAISAAQVLALSPAQIGIIAGINVTTAGGTVYSGISYLNSGAFASLSPAQIAVLTPTEKASLSAAQHTSCGC